MSMTGTLVRPGDRVFHRHFASHINVGEEF
jgi:hypothetical protein